MEDKLERATVSLLTYMDSNNPEIVQAQLNEIIELVGQVTISPANGTRMICSECSSINAPGYRLRRSAGKYLAFCVDEFGGCAGKQITHKCNFVDNVGVECDQAAEYQITYGADKLITRYACVIHTGILLKDTENTVTPLK